MTDPELEQFKRNIDLREYASGQGYVLDPKESCRASAVMRLPGNDDKLIIKRTGDGHYVYFSVRDDRDKGTIIDFVSNRLNLSLGAIRKELRCWSGHSPSPPHTSFPTDLVAVPRDRGAVLDRYSKMSFVDNHPYLLRVRNIPSAVLSHWRFAESVKMDVRGNAVFPHFDDVGICGYELKNKAFTGFASGGAKGLWLSATTARDRRFVVAESAIDALSYASLFPSEESRYASIGGKPNPQQPALLKSQILSMESGSEIVAAMDLIRTAGFSGRW
jgi:hypothetical protein